MIPVAVDLDDDALRAPGEVDREVFDAVVHGGPLDRVRGAELEEDRLGLTACERGLVLDARDELGQSRGARAVGVRPEHGVQRAEVEHAQHERLLDRALQRAGRQHRGEVEQRTGRRRHADPVAPRELRRAEVARAVKHDPRALAQARAG